MKSNLKAYCLLHITLALYSLSGIFSKLAARQHFLSIYFFIYYMVILTILVLYAIGWQQIIKRLPLTMAFTSKGITVVWGIIWGAVFFHETITPGKLIGAILIITGIIVFSNIEDDAQHG